MPVKKKVEVEVEVSENDKPILVAETESPQPTPEPPTEAVVETLPPIDTAQIFGPTIAEPPSSNKKLFWTLIVIFALLGAAAGGVGIYLQKSRGQTPTVVPTPTSAAMASPTPTPAAELNREDLSVQVFNGSGVTGAAADAAEFLEGLGYANVAAGNADSSNYATTQIAIKDSKKDYLALVKSDLEKEYTLNKEVETLEENGNYDVVITLGKE